MYFYVTICSIGDGAKACGDVYALASSVQSLRLRLFASSRHCIACKASSVFLHKIPENRDAFCLLCVSARNRSSVVRAAAFFTPTKGIQSEINNLHVLSHLGVSLSLSPCVSCIPRLRQPIPDTKKSLNLNVIVVFAIQDSPLAAHRLRFW